MATSACTVTMANAMFVSGDNDFRLGSNTSMNLSAISINGSMQSNNHNNTPSLVTTTLEAQVPRRKKSVDFTLFHSQQEEDAATTLQQYKRMRWTPKQVVDALATGVTRSERMEAIQKAVETFESHDDESHHNQEMAAGADAALWKHFVFAMQMGQMEFENTAVTAISSTNSSSSSEDRHGTTITTEMMLTVQALELVYRSSSSMVRASFVRMGSIALRLLLDVIERELDRRIATEPLENDAQGGDDNDTNFQNNYDCSHDASLFLQYATKLLGHFARVGDAIKPLANFPKCLRILLRLCQTPYVAIPWQARLSALWVVANLACDSENMISMTKMEGLVKTLVKVARRPLDENTSAIHGLEHVTEILRSRNIVSRAILNLSWAPANKSLLAENAVLLDLLAELSVHRQAAFPSSRAVASILLPTRRHSVGALRNLAAAPKRVKLYLCEYRQGHLLDVLTDAALNDSDDQVKEEAFAAINNLAIQDTAEQMMNHTALVLALRNVLTNSDSNAEEISAMRLHASSTIMVLERTITPSMDAFMSLRELLQAVNPAPVQSDGDDERDSERSLAISGDDDMRIVHNTMAV